jgi:hypothetical protein
VPSKRGLSYDISTLHVGIFGLEELALEKLAGGL